MTPADQRLDREDRAGVQVDLGLVVQDELVAQNGAAQRLVHPKLFLDPEIDLRLVELERVASALLGPVHGGVGVGEQGLGVAPVVGKGRNSDAAGDAQDVPVDPHLLRDRRLKAGHRFRDVLDALGLVAEHDDEFVAAEPHHDVRRAHAPTIRRGDGPEQLVAGVVAEAVVDVFEIVDVDEGDGRPAVVALGEQQRLASAGP